MKTFIFTLIFTTLAILTRTTFHIAPNVEFLTAIGLSSGYFIDKKSMRFLPLISSIVITDFILKNSIIFIFTWSAFLITPLLGQYLKNNSSNFIKIITLEGSAIISTLIFFLWTNLGVVITTNMYPKNLVGLIQSYINALPFLANQIIGNIFIVPIVFILASLINFAIENLIFKFPLTAYKLRN